jgi:hypothetical protein
MNTSLRLTDLLARNVRVEWFEAVALVRDVCDRLVERSATMYLPELDDVELSPDGRVTVTGGTKTDEPVRRLGQLLQAVLAQSDPPVQLRLLVSQVLGPTPSFGSVPEYSNALGYFERPDRAAVLAALYARGDAVPAPQYMPPLTLETFAPIETQPTPDAPAKKPHKPSTPSQRFVAAAVLLGVAGVSALSLAGPSPALKAGSWLGRASDVLGAGVLSGMSTVMDKVGLGRVVAKDAAPSGPPPAPVATVSAPAPVEAAYPRAKSQPARLDMALPQPVQRILSRPDSRNLPPIVAAVDIVPSQIAEREVLPAVAIAGDGDGSGKVIATEVSTSEGPTIYTAGAAGVEAPIPIRPQLPRELPSNADQSHLGRIELVVMPDGRVGSVKLLDLPNNVHEAMFLSAVKAWVLSPAVKDGRPVAYRKIVWVAFQ